MSIILISLYFKYFEKHANYKPRKYTCTINIPQVRIPPPIYDVVLADSDVKPSCRFSHAMAHIKLNENTTVSSNIRRHN